MPSLLMSAELRFDTMDDRGHYRALVAKDARFDGVFFTGVKTTGIYCRPICHVKTPKESSCVFFDSAAKAEEAGFRPCLRCRPELSPYALQKNLAHAVWQKIAAGSLNEGNLDDLSQQVGLSSRQLRRVLVQEFGVGPIELAQTQRLLFAKKLLQETDLPMIELAFSAGFGSVRRFNALFEERYHLAPSAIRKKVKTNKLSVMNKDELRVIDDNSIVLRLAYRPPYAWDALLTYLKGRAMPGLEMVDEVARCYRRSVRLGDLGQECGWISVQNLPQSHQLALQVSSNLTPVLMPLLAKIRQQFDVDANPLVIAAHLQSDIMLAQQMQRTPGLRVAGCFDHFELAIRAVLGQQVSVAGATTVAGRLVQKFGDTFETPWKEVNRHFPKPQVLAAASIESLASIGIPKSRAATVQGVARFAAHGGLDALLTQDAEHAVAQLKTLSGIGEWTAQYIAMRALRFPNAFPAGDLGLQKAAAIPPETRLTEKQLLIRAQAWAPWRSYAALLLWQSLVNLK